MSSAVKAKLTTKVMTNWMILTTSMGFQALRKEGVPKAFEAREKLRRLRTPALRTDADWRDKCDSRRPQPQRLNKGTKKDAMCKHKKSGCVCFIVARLRASALRNRDIEDNKALCAPTDPTAKLRIHARTRKIHRNKKQTHFSASNYPPDKTRGKETRLPDHHNKQGNFSPSSPHSARRHVIQFVRTPLCFALTPARVYAHSAVFRLLPSPFTTSPYSHQNVTIRGEGFAFVRSSPSSPEKRISTHPIFSYKASSIRRHRMGELLPFSSFT